MKTLWFVMPIHGRIPLASICVRQLRRTCDDLYERGVLATAVLVGARRDLDGVADRLGSLLGFGWVIRNNRSVSRKFNDGIQLALDKRYNPQPADYVVPVGSDDWVHADALLPLPPDDTVRGFQTISFVSETGDDMISRTIGVPGGWGIRTYPRALLKPLSFRPAEEDRNAGCDTSILVNVHRDHGDRLRIVHGDIDPRLVVDWKTEDEQLHPFDSLYRMRAGNQADPYDALADLFPADSLEAMRHHYRVGV